MFSPMKKGVRIAALATITAMIGTATFSYTFAADPSNDKGASMSGAELSKPSDDIIQIATGDNMGDVSTLVKAIEAAGLTQTLRGPGTFTVFAPTNEAFAKLPEGTLDDLLKPENKDKLRAILLYHVHTGDAIMAKDIKPMDLTSADNDKKLHITKDGDTVMVNNAKVIKTDIVAKNGVIHWIDTVVMPD